MGMETAPLGLEVGFGQPRQLAGRAGQESLSVTNVPRNRPSAEWAPAHGERETMAMINTSST